MVRYVIGCLIVGLVLFLLFVGVTLTLIFIYGDDIANWFGDMFQQLPDWLQFFAQNIQN